MSIAKRSASSGDRETRGQGDQGIEVLNRQRICAINRDAVSQLSREVLDRIGREEAMLTIMFIRDRQMQRLNRDYRRLDKPTDVLSFAYHETEDHNESNHLGDVVISVETAERYARELGLSVDREIQHLVIHGTLHLAGYDHETDNGEMDRLEGKLRKQLLR